MKKLPALFLSVLMVILIAILCPGCGSGDSTSVFSALPSSTVSPGPSPTTALHTLIVEPDDGKTAILDAIRKAETSIKLTIYEVDDPDVIEELESAAGRGLDVRIIYNYYSFSEEKQEYIKKAMEALEAKGIRTKPANEKYTYTHEKTFVFDDDKSIIMSFNLQPDYFSSTRDFAIITTSLPEVSEIGKVFEADWLYQDVTPSVESLVWSPVNSREKLIKLIQSAKKTMEIYNEEVLDEEVIEELIKAAKSGVEVRFISAQLKGWDGTDSNIPGRKKLNENGAYAKYGDFLYIHGKMILVDYGTNNSRAYVGSENFSSTSLDKNRELGIIVEEKEIIDRIHSIFNIDWEKAKYD